MLYAALAFWLLVLIFSATGVYSQWCRLLPPRTVNLLLLPGTLISQLGLVAGMLLSGQTVRNTSLLGGDAEAGPQSDPPQESRIPVLGPILVGMMPVVACLVALWLASWLLGGRPGPGSAAILLPGDFPTSAALVWVLLHELLRAAEAIVGALASADMLNWRSVLRTYLAICLVIRMAPPPAHQRGVIGAVALVAGVLCVLGLVWPGTPAAVSAGWPMLSYCVAISVALLLLTLGIRGLISLVRIVVRGS